MYSEEHVASPTSFTCSFTAKDRFKRIMKLPHRHDRLRRIRLGVLCLLITSATSFFPRAPTSCSCQFHREHITATTRHRSRISELAAEKPRNGNQNKKKRKGSRFSQTAHNPPSQKDKRKTPQFNSDRVSRNKKSIEELEERLTSRWGTNLSKWTAQDGELDLDGEEERGDSKHSDATPVFRARPVQDPWAVNKTGEKKSPSFWESSVDNAHDKSAGLARRAQRNQERLQAAKGQPDAPEFDDEGDVGFEPRANKRSDRSGLDMDDLTGEEPVGGRGTFQHKTDVGSTQQETFFFSPPPVRPTEESDGVKERPEKRESRRRDPSIPVLGEDGNPILLTLQQANANFHDSLHTDGDRDDMNQSEKPCEWADLGITSPFLLQNLKNMQCERPLSVQEKACRPVIEKHDVLVGTYTGSGKEYASLYDV